MNLRPVLISAAKSVVAASLMALGVYYVYSKWLITTPGTQLSVMVFHLGALIVIGIIIYFGAARVLGCREIASIREILSRKTGR